MRLLLARHPDRSDANYALIIEEFTSLNLTGKPAAVTEMIAMLGDLHAHGRASRYLRNLTGTPLMELKPATRRGQRGGARVYLWLLPDDAAAIVNCEAKAPDAPTSVPKLKVALTVYLAHQRGARVLSAGPHDGNLR